MGRLRTAGSAAFLAIGGFLFGYDSGIISSTIAQPHFIQYMGTPSHAETGGIVSSFTGGAILGSLSISYLADKLGRKMTVFIGALISCLGCALQGGAANIPMIIAGRFIAGIAVGILSAVVPMYSSEIATSQDRGKLSGLLQFMLSWGFFIAQWLGYGCFKVDSDFQWRFPLSFQVVPGLIIASGIWFMPESPRWLIEKDRYDEAQAVLQKLHATGDNQEFLDLEFLEIRDTIVAEKATMVKSWKQMLAKKSWRKRLMLGMGVQAFGQLSGINVSHALT
jgi:sugar porter (SP) family MFS transporter